MNWPTMRETITETHAVTPAEWALLDSHGITLSNAYIGMLRAYHGNRTVWQTHWMGAYTCPRNEVGGVDFGPLTISLTKQLHEWLDRLAEMGDEAFAIYVRDTNLHLFS